MVFVVAHPGRFLCQRSNHTLVQPSRRTEVADLDAGVSAQFVRVEPSGQRLALAPVPLMIDQPSESLQETQFPCTRILLLGLIRSRPNDVFVVGRRHAWAR